MHQSTTFSQSRKTHRSSTTLRISLNQKSRISAQIERDLAKLFIYGALAHSRPLRRRPVRCSAILSRLHSAGAAGSGREPSQNGLTIRFTGSGNGVADMHLLWVVSSYPCFWQRDETRINQPAADGPPEKFQTRAVC